MESYEYGGFNSTRKRNIDLGIATRKVVHETENPAVGIDTNVKQIPKEEQGNIAPMKSNVIVKRRPKPIHFGEGYQKVTVYLPTDLLELLKQLMKTRQISSYSEGITEALNQQWLTGQDRSYNIRDNYTIGEHNKCKSTRQKI